MKVDRPILFIILFSVSWIIPQKGLAQIFKPQIDIAIGGGFNAAYFDIGGGTPGYSLYSSTMYHWTEHWETGLFFGVHRLKGTDEGTPELGRGLAFDSNLYEFSGRVEYLFYYSSSWKKKYKQKINPMLPYGGTWKRKIKPFLFAGGGVLQYKPYVYNYVTERGIDENPGLSKVAPIVNGGFGVHYYMNRYFSVSVEFKANFPIFNYTEHVTIEEIDNKWDIFYLAGIRFVWSLSAS
jgi:hypothetical protein